MKFHDIYILDLKSVCKLDWIGCVANPEQAVVYAMRFLKAIGGEKMFIRNEEIAHNYGVCLGSPTRRLGVFVQDFSLDKKVETTFIDLMTGERIPSFVCLSTVIPEA